MKESNYTTIHDTALSLLQSQWDTITFAEVLPIQTAADIVTSVYLLNDQLKAIGFDYIIAEDCSGVMLLSFIVNYNKLVCINCGERRWLKSDESDDTLCAYESLEDDLSHLIDLMNFAYFLTVST